MKIAPVIKSSDLQRSLRFYTEVLDFERKWPGHEDRELANGVIDLARDGAELQLSRHSGDGVFGSVNRVFVDDVDDVDECYQAFRRRGLKTQRPESPIHTAPVDQRWGLCEFAVTDPDGNNLCFCMPPKDDALKTRSEVNRTIERYREFFRSELSRTIERIRMKPWLKWALQGALGRFGECDRISCLTLLLVHQ